MCKEQRECKLKNTLAPNILISRIQNTDSRREETAVYDSSSSSYLVLYLSGWNWRHSISVYKSIQYFRQLNMNHLTGMIKRVIHMTYLQWNRQNSIEMAPSIMHLWNTRKEIDRVEQRDVGEERESERERKKSIVPSGCFNDEPHSHVMSYQGSWDIVMRSK